MFTDESWQLGIWSGFPGAKCAAVAEKTIAITITIVTITIITVTITIVTITIITIVTITIITVAMISIANLDTENGWRWRLFPSKLGKPSNLFPVWVLK